MYSFKEWNAASVPILSVRLICNLPKPQRNVIQWVETDPNIFNGNRRPESSKLMTYPTIGATKSNFVLDSVISCLVSGWSRSRYLINWPVHQMWGSPCIASSLSAMSDGIDTGKYGGRGFKKSTIGSCNTWTSCLPAETCKHKYQFTK